MVNMVNMGFSDRSNQHTLAMVGAAEGPSWLPRLDELQRNGQRNGQSLHA